jgi:hypothetical protein
MFGFDELVKFESDASATDSVTATDSAHTESALGTSMDCVIKPLPPSTCHALAARASRAGPSGIPSWK